MTERAPFRLLKRAARFRAARFVFISIFVRDCSAAHYSLNNCHVERRAEGPASQVGGTSIIAIRTGFCSSDPRDPSIPLRFTRGDSLCCHVERRGGQPRSRNIPTAPDIHRRDPHGMTNGNEQSGTIPIARYSSYLANYCSLSCFSVSGAGVPPSLRRRLRPPRWRRRRFSSRFSPPFGA